MAPYSTREQILQQLHGQTVRVPDLKPLYASWPHHVNPAQSAVTETVQYVLENHSMSKAVEMKLKRANLGLLIASWYPFASAQTLKDITYFVCWMYVVDDAVVDKVSWPGSDNEKAFEAAYNDIMTFVGSSLEITEHTTGHNPHSTIEAVSSFAPIARVLCRSYTYQQRLRVYTSCKLTIDGYRTEQQLRLSGHPPTWSQYYAYREGSSCISMCVAMIELASNLHLPDYIVNSPEVQDLWRETTVNCWLANDILSAKKEMNEGFIENAVVLLARETEKAQDGMDATVQMLVESIARFDGLAKVVEGKFCGDDRTTAGELRNGDRKSEDVNGTLKDSADTIAYQFRRFVEGCRCLATGSLYWSLVSARYGLAGLPVDENGGMTFIIGT